MNQKFTLILAAGITAFVLVVGGAMINRAAVQSEPAATLTPDFAEIQDMYAQREAEIQDLYTQREAEYQSRIAEANAALAAAFAQQEDEPPSSTPTQSAVEPVPATISPQDAMLVAATLAPRAKILSRPELVNYEGTVAYEVTLDTGLVYVDANTGAVLYNGTTQPQKSVQRGSFHEDEEHEEEHEHERGEDHDD